MQGPLLDSGHRLEDLPIDIGALVSSNLTAIVVGLAFVSILALVAALSVLRRVSRLEARLGSLTRGEDGRSLESILGAHLDKVLAVGRAVDELALRATALEVAGRSAFQRVGLVRYNPFEETGGNQSFALALLDADDHGVIISSLHARAGTRVYAKAVTSGRPAGALSDEEAEALRLARGATKGRPAIAEHAVAGPTQGS